MAFFGRETVLADLDLHRDMAGGVTTGTLVRLGSTPITYANVCPWPGNVVSGLGHQSAATDQTLVTAWRVGEAGAPSPDDSWVVGAKTYVVVSITTRHNADEAGGYAIYDCTCTRKA